MSSVIVIGCPWVGKTGLAKRVWPKLWCDVYDGDDEFIKYISQHHPQIAQKAELANKDVVAVLLEEVGDDRFVEIETAFHEERFPNGAYDRQGNRIIYSASGSMPLAHGLVERFKEQGAHFLLLTRDVSRIAKNCQDRADGTSRIVGMQRFWSLEAVIEYRRGIYARLADSVLDLWTESDRDAAVTRMYHHIRRLQAAPSFFDHPGMGMSGVSDFTWAI